MRILLVAAFGLLWLGSAPTLATAQDGDAEALNTENGQPVIPAVSTPYETINLPKDHAAAWEMLRAANGLHGDGMQPWYLSAHYKTYDAYGHSRTEGTLEYIWIGRDSWKVTYTEGATVWVRWKTSKGIYAPAGQSDSPGYPESLLTGQIRDPLGGIGAPKMVPEYAVDENFSSLTLSCFRNKPLFEAVRPMPNGPVPLRRFCSVQGRPILRYAQGSYTGFYNKSAVLQHRIVAQQVNLRDGNDPVLDIDISALKSPTNEQFKLLLPPADAVLIRDTSLFLPSEVVTGYVTKKIQPKYPSEMKAERVQGTVRLAVVIGADGHVTITDVLHRRLPH